MSLWLEGKSIVIIGGTSGIGLAATRAFIEEGARVVAVGLDPDTCDRAKAEFTSDAVVLTGDATRENTAALAVETCVKHFASFDGLYHVAGGSGRKYGDGPLHEMTLEGWNQTITLNLTSLMLSNQAAVKKFMERRTGGSILNMGSVLGMSPSPKYFVTHAYAASKAAVEGFTRSTAAYYASYNVRINSIAPGLVETPMSLRAAGNNAIMNFVRTKQPLSGGRIGSADDLTGAAVYFMSDLSAFATGQTLCVDGGWSVSEGQYPTN